MVVGGSNINNIRYADDTVLLATSVEKLQGLVDNVVLESAKRGLCVNTKTTECMIIPVATRLRVLECYVLPVLKYGSETWNVSKEMEKRSNASEMWFLRRFLRIACESHTTNEEVLMKADTERKLMKTIKKQLLQFLGHCMRKDGMEKLAHTGKIAGKRARGRQRLTFLQSIAEWSGRSAIGLIQCTESWNWHKMVADVIR
ncbi:uncharacterized protein [Penaeus vannamei]|uniref:uncharacterized protein n=1 Tax=Penaeus vannamei TaxID=6689 RepID=UPI00387F600F